jgi:hypothetical protein
MTQARTPASAQAAIDASIMVAGTARIATSIGPACRISAIAGRPATDARFGLIGTTRPA